MASALLTPARHFDQDSPFAKPSRLVQRDESAQQMALSQLLHGPANQEPPYGFGRAISEMDSQRQEFQPWRFPLLPSPIVRTRHRNHFGDAIRALEQIEAMRKNRETQRQVQDEAAWIAANGAKFAGRWVALLGQTLLAVGDSAKEVYEAAQQTAPTPLIVRMEHDTLPFAGW